MMTVGEFLALDPRDMDGYFAEHVLGYKRTKAPPDAAGENGGYDILTPPAGLGDFVLPLKGRIHFAYMAPVLAQDPWKGDTLHHIMVGRAFRRTLETGNDVTVAWTKVRDGRRGSYHMANEKDHLICALVAACLALGVLKDGDQS